MAVHTVRRKAQREEETTPAQIVSYTPLSERKLVMWRLMNRVVLTVGFLAVVWLVVAEPKVQGQSKGSHRIHMPLVTQKSTGTEDPALHDYVGLLYDYRENEKAYYTVRGMEVSGRRLRKKG